MKKPRIAPVLAGVFTGLIGVIVGAAFAVHGVHGSFSHLLTVSTPHDPAGFWGLVTGVGTVALVIVAYRGLRSLGLTKKDMLNRATRDARACAVTRCEQFAREIIPTNEGILNSLAENKIPVFAKNAAAVRFGPDNAEDLAAAGKWVESLPPKVYNDIVGLLNTVETWAMYFCAGLADQKVAYQPCSTLYISFIIQSYPLLLALRSSPAISGQFPNLTLLYSEWVGRKEDEERSNRMAQIFRQLQELQSKGTGAGQAAARAARIPAPLGTNLDY